jgi:hypothetical protein
VAGKRGRSGPPGNLNGIGTKSHPWAVFWRRRALAAHHRWIVPILLHYADGLVADKGGSESVTAGEHRVIEITQTARGASMLILAEARRSGFIRQVDGTWDLSPGAKELAKFLSIERTALQTLGLDRRPRPVESLSDIAREYSERATEIEAEGKAGKP